MNSRVPIAFALGVASLLATVRAEAATEGSTSSDTNGALAAEGTAKKPTSAHQGLVGGQAFWVASKVMPGIVLRFDLHRYFWLDLEGGFVFTTDPPPGRSAVVGSPFGAHVLVAPYRTPHVELAAGLGMDVHYLWGVNADLAEVALSVIVSGHYWFTPHLGMFGSARAYPVATSGLDLGEYRDGSAGLPILFATGVAWSFP